MAEALREWWRTNRGVVWVTVVVAVVSGLAFGIWTGPRAGALVLLSVVAVVGVLMLSSATMNGMQVTLDRQIAMRERDAARREQPKRDLQ